MASTGTYAFSPAASNLTLSAFGRIGIRRTEITAQHMADADTEANLLQVEMASRVPNLWKVELYTVTMVEGTAEYTLPTRLVGIRDAFIRTTSGGTSTDRVVWPLSTAEWDAQPNKSLEAPPQSYWINKTMAPTVTMWPVPDGSATYTLYLRMMTQIQDVSLKSGATLDVPYRWIEVFVAGLAYRLSKYYAQPIEDKREKDYEKAWANAAMEDVEDNTSVYVSPAFGGYYR